MNLKNLIGDVLGYARCPITGDSLYNGYANVWYKNNHGLLISKKAAKLNPFELSRQVYEHIIEEESATKEETSPLVIFTLNNLENLKIKRPRFWDSLISVDIGSIEQLKED